MCWCMGDIQLYDLYTGVKLREYAMEEEDVLRSLNAVSATKKQVERVRFDVCMPLPFQVCSYIINLPSSLFWTVVLVSGDDFRGRGQQRYDIDLHPTGHMIVY